MCDWSVCGMCDWSVCVMCGYSVCGMCDWSVCMMCDCPNCVSSMLYYCIHPCKLYCVILYDSSYYTSHSCRRQISHGSWGQSALLDTPTQDAEKQGLHRLHFYIFHHMLCCRSSSGHRWRELQEMLRYQLMRVLMMQQKNCHNNLHLKPQILLLHHQQFVAPKFLSNKKGRVKL